MLYCCGLFFIYSCNLHAKKEQASLVNSIDDIQHAQSYQTACKRIDSLKQFIRSGDLITRTGNDFTSESLKQLNRRDKRFSHCGIASIEHDTVFVYHALGGEFNPDQKILREPIQSFGYPLSNNALGVFRYKLTGTENSHLLKTVKQLYFIGIPFDMKFDLKTDSSMYCAEFVYKALLLGTHGRLNFNISKINQFSFIGVDDLFLQSQCNEIGTVHLKKQESEKIN